MWKFPPSQVELSLVDAVSKGEIWSPSHYREWMISHRLMPKAFSKSGGQNKRRRLLKDEEPDNHEHPAEVSNGGDAIRAEFIRELILGRVSEEDCPTWHDESGIRIGDAVIIGTFDLTSIDYDKPIEIINSSFESIIFLRNARLRQVRLTGCKVPSIEAENVHIDGNFELTLVRTGAISLLNAKLKGTLNLKGAVLKPENGNHIGPVLNCEGAEFGASALLHRGFIAEGEVSLVLVQINGHLSCSGGTFRNAGGKALHCNSARIGGSVLLREGFESVGEVNFVRSRITGNLHCHDASFEDVEGIAVELRSCQIEGVFYFCELRKIKGMLNLRDTKTKSFADDGTGWPGKNKLVLDGFEYESFTESYIDGAQRTVIDAKRRLHWILCQPNNDLQGDFKPQPWTHLSKVLREMGHSQNARFILRKRSSWRFHHGPRKWWNWIEWPFRLVFWGWLTGYGYALRRPIVVIVAIWSIGWVMFSVAQDTGLMRPAPAIAVLDSEYLERARAANSMYESFEPWLYSLDVFLPFATLHQESNWIPHDAGDISVDLRKTYPGLVKLPNSFQPWVSWAERELEAGAIKKWFWFQIVAGWILMSIVIVGFSGLLRREE